MSQSVEKIPYLLMMKIPSKSSWIRCRSRWLTKFNQYFLVVVSSKIFVKIQSVIFTWSC